MMGATAGRIGQSPLQKDAVVHDGVVPFPRVFLVQSFFDERHELVVLYFFASATALFLLDFRKEKVDVDGADIRFYKRAGDIEGEGEYGAGCIRPYAGQVEKLVVSLWKLALIVFYDDLHKTMQIKTAAVVAKALPFFQDFG